MSTFDNDNILEEHDDILFETLKHLSVKDIKRLCSTSKRFHAFCKYESVQKLIERKKVEEERERERKIQLKRKREKEMEDERSLEDAVTRLIFRAISRPPTKSVVVEYRDRTYTYTREQQQQDREIVECRINRSNGSESRFLMSSYDWNTTVTRIGKDFVYRRSDDRSYSRVLSLTVNDFSAHLSYNFNTEDTGLEELRNDMYAAAEQLSDQ
jgi:hypothetical protein